MPPTDRTTTRLGDEITDLCSRIYAAEHRLLTLIRSFDEQRGWEHQGFPGCACWLNFKCGIDMNTARERIRVAHALGGLPGIDAEFAKGALSYSKVRAMTRIATPENEEYLLGIARHGTAHHVEKLVRKYRRAAKVQEDESASADRNDRRLDYYYDDDGVLVMNGRFPAEVGALLVKALEMAMDRDFADAPADHVPSEHTRDDREPVSRRRADALAEVAETYMNAAPVPNSTADRYQVVVHVCAGGNGSSETPGAVAHLDNGPDVSAETSRRVACDCSILRVDEDTSGEPLSIGRKTRSIPPAIRRALQLRDDGCRFPGCTHDRFVDGHHIRHWADGGATSLDNLVLLCRHHHHLVHEGGFTCEKAADGELVFTNAFGETLPGYATLPAVSKVELDVWLDEELFERGVDADSCAAKWYAGDRMDWNMAVSGLFL